MDLVYSINISRELNFISHLPVNVIRDLLLIIFNTGARKACHANQYQPTQSSYTPSVVEAFLPDMDLLARSTNEIISYVWKAQCFWMLKPLFKSFVLTPLSQIAWNQSHFHHLIRNKNM